MIDNTGVAVPKAKVEEQKEELKDDDLANRLNALMD